jgi:hypothetical protein
MEFAWTLCLLAICGGTIFHRNIWSFSKCSKKSKSVASDHNFFFFFQIHCMLQLTNLVQVITECRSCSANAVLRAYARQSAPTVRALPSAHALQVRARILSAPCRSRLDTRPVCAPCGVRAWSYPRLYLFPFAPAVVPIGARHASVDSHLILPIATSAGNSKKSYCSKVNLEQ